MQTCTTIKIPFGNDPTTTKTIDMPYGAMDLKIYSSTIHDGNIHVGIVYNDNFYPEKTPMVSLSFRAFADAATVPSIWNYVTTVFNHGQSWHLFCKE